MSPEDFIAGIRRRARPQSDKNYTIAFKEEAPVHAMLLASGYVENFTGVLRHVRNDRVHWDIDNLERRVVDHVAFRISPVQWVTQEGIACYPSQMLSSHLINTIKMIREGRMRRDGCNSLSKVDWIEIFINELMSRKITETKSVD